MCGRFVSPEAAAIERVFQLRPHAMGVRLSHIDQQWQTWPGSVNLAPTELAPMLFLDGDAHNGQLARFGMIPSWWTMPKPPSLSFNARSEEAASKPMWRDALKHRRCLVPMLGWYEWQTGTGGNKQAFLVEGQPPQQPMLFAAGLYAAASADRSASFALLTTAARPEIADLHARMPLLVASEWQHAWLAGDAALQELRLALQTAFAPFSKRAFDPRQATDAERRKQAGLFD
jgi:putative SOS response-associated peptidase YedK